MVSVPFCSLLSVVLVSGDHRNDPFKIVDKDNETACGVHQTSKLVLYGVVQGAATPKAYCYTTCQADERGEDPERYAVVRTLQ